MNDANKSMEGPQQQFGDTGGDVEESGGRGGGGGGRRVLGGLDRKRSCDGEASVGATTSTEMSTVSQSFLYYQENRHTTTDFQHSSTGSASTTTTISNGAAETNRMSPTSPQEQQLVATKASIQEQLPSTTYHRHHVQLPPQYQATVEDERKQHIRYQPIQYQIEYEKQQFQQNSALHRNGGGVNRATDSSSSGNHRHSSGEGEIAVSLISPSAGPQPMIVSRSGMASSYSGSVCQVESGEVAQQSSPVLQLREVKIRSGTPSVIIEQGNGGSGSGTLATTAATDEAGLEENGGELVNEGSPGGGSASSKRGRSKHRPLFRRLFHYVRNSLIRQANKGDQDECEVYELPPRYRPESVSSLCQITRFSEEEVKRLYRGFKAECPSGIVREDTFKTIYSQFFSTRANTGNYAHFVFNTLDHDNSGIINFEDFLQTLSILSRGTMEEKLTWTFALYDINGDGCVTREEMTEIVSAIYDMVDTRPGSMNGICENDFDEPLSPGPNPGGPVILANRADGERIKQKVDQIFQKMDMNQDGVVTLDEFIISCRNDEVITNSMIVFDNIVL